MTTPTDNRKQMTRAERIDNLLDHASDYVVEKGWESLNMEGLAARAGVSKSLPYKHFANRNEVLRALWVRETTVMDLSIAKATDGIEALDERIRAAAHVWLDSVEAGGSVHVLDRAGVGCADLQALRRARMEMYQEQWAARAMLEYDIDPKDAIVVSAILIGGLLNLVEKWSTSGPERDRAIEIYAASSVACFRAIQRPSA